VSRTKYVKSSSEILAYRLTQPEGNNRTVALLLDKLVDGSQNISMGLCVIDPKSQIPYHMHEKEEEAMYVLKGKGKAKIESAEYDLSEGSVIFIPPKMGHQIVNTANKELRFLFVYGPSGPEQSVKAKGKPEPFR